MENAEFVSSSPALKAGKACDLIVFRVPKGREDVWVEAAQLWPASFSADARPEPGLVGVIVPRRHTDVPVDTTATLEGITHQYRLNTDRKASA